MTAETLFDPLFLSRLQFALKALFHILWSSLSIGLILYIFLMEALWLRRKDNFYYIQARFWTRFFLLIFAIGVVSGIPMGFEFGTNWGRFAAAKNGFIGEMLGVEATMAFMLEAGFLGIMAFGWGRVSKGLHLFATAMVALGTSLSAFWIMVANSWMQTPSGLSPAGSSVVTSYLQAIFNPDMPWGVSHMYVAALETTLFFVGAVSAWYLLRRRHTDFFLRSFKIVLAAAVFIAPLQVLVGDMSGKAVARHQPAKLAAFEAHWETNPPGTGAAWKAVAWPDQAKQANNWEIEIPNVLSLLLTYSPTGEVKGLKEFPREDQPPVLITFYTFRIMFSIGFALVFLMLWTLWEWRKGHLKPEALPDRKALLYAWMIALPLSYTAIEMGWVTREVGRQPWLIYGLIRTNEAASVLPSGAVAASLAGYLIVYSVLFFFFVVMARGILMKGPDLHGEPSYPTLSPPPGKEEESR